MQHKKISIIVVTINYGYLMRSNRKKKKLKLPFTSANRTSTHEYASTQNCYQIREKSIKIRLSWSNLFPFFFPINIL